MILLAGCQDPIKAAIKCNQIHSNYPNGLIHFGSEMWNVMTDAMCFSRVMHGPL